MQPSYSTFSSRISADQETLGVLPPIEGLLDMPICSSLEEALIPLHSIVEGDLSRQLPLSLSFAESFPHDLRQGLASINLYTREWTNLGPVLNAQLLKEDRQNLFPFFPFLGLFLSTFSKLPEFKGEVWRGVKQNLTGHYTKGKKLFWWAITSCTPDETVLQTDSILGQTGDRTIFHVRCLRGYDITEYSISRSEKEILLLPGTYLEVVDSVDSGNGLHVIVLEELVPSFPIIPLDLLKSSVVPQESLTPEESYEIARKFFEGKAVTQNFGKSLQYFQNSAERGHRGAMYYLGVMYGDGLGVTRNYETAFHYFRKLAEMEDPAGLKELGKMYRNGLGVPRNYTQALEYYRRAADQGHPSGLNNLGYMYRRGLGVPRDDILALKYYRLAADRGNASAANNVGYMYREGLGVKMDPDVAVKYFRAAADKGSASGLANLGGMYEKGVGVPQDYALAVQYYRQAAEQGSPYGQYMLGLMYRHGTGVARDEEMAVRYILLATKQGYTPDLNSNPSSLPRGGREKSKREFDDNDYEMSIYYQFDTEEKATENKLEKINDDEDLCVVC